jgi:murein DD-endopeptidase MepM/ murein hydrolase activator NlpD
VILGSPVHGIIHPTGWSRPAGNIDVQVTQPFGCTGFAAERPLGNCAHFHRGIDFGNGSTGADLLAVAAGTVTQAGRNPDGALVVVVDHGNGLFTGHAHLEDKVVNVGDQVSVGQKVGDLGMSGNALGPHDHLGVKTGLTDAAYFWGDTHGTWVDPWPLLAQNQPGDDVDPTKDIPIGLADIGPTTLYADRAGASVLAANWKGAKSVGVYSKAAVGTSNAKMPHGPVAIRIGPPLRLAWVDNAAVKLIAAHV